jgi:AraC-like DNA-binding protein
MKIKDKSWKIRNWQVAGIDGLELLHASNVTHDYPRHIHEEPCLVLMQRGHEVNRCRKGTFVATAGEVMLLNADEAHTSQSIGAEYRMMSIPQRLLEQLASEAWGREMRDLHFSHPVVRNKAVFRSLLKLHLSFENPSSTLEQQSRFASTVIDLLCHINLRVPEGVGREKCRLRLVRDHIREHYSENISLEALAEIAGLSSFHLLRVFRTHVGIPPHEYQTHLRVNKARGLLRAGHTIAETSLMLGFCDQSHFSRNFRRITGMTPGYYASYSR